MTSSLARLRPERLDSVHCAAVSLQTDNLAIRTCHCSAGTNRHHTPDCTARQVEIVMRRTSGSIIEIRQAGAYCLVSEDGTFRKTMRDHLDHRASIELAALRQGWRCEHGDVGRRRRRVQHVSQCIKCCCAVLV